MASATSILEARKLREQIANSSTITPEQAVLFSNAVQITWGSNALPTWSEKRASIQFNDALRLIQAAEIERAAATGEDWRNSYRRAGDLLEWVLRSNPSEFGEHLGLIAAAAYQLAGYPAMATALLLPGKRASNDFAIFSAFLRADFDSVLGLSLHSLSPNALKINSKLSEEGNLEQFLIVTELTRTLALISGSLRKNNFDRLEIGIERLGHMSRYLAHSAPPIFWMFSSLLLRTSQDFAESSAWKHLKQVRRSLSDNGKRKLDAFARGMFFAKRGLLWKSQAAGIERLAEESSFAMCTPTGSGKTTIAELAIVQQLFQAELGDDKALVIYIVPSRALANEVESRLAVALKAIDPEIKVTGLYGGNDWGQDDSWTRFGGPVVLISTVEKAEALFRYVGTELFQRLQLVVVDEAHQIQYIDNGKNRSELLKGESRAARLESFLTRVQTHLPNARVIALSAVAGGTETYLAQWLENRQAASPVGVAYRSTRQLIGALRCYPDGQSRIELEVLNGKRLALTSTGREAYVPLTFPKMPKVTGSLRSGGPFLQAHVLWLALNLANAKRRVLISVTQKIEDVLSNFCTLLENQREWRTKVPEFFQVPVFGKGKEEYESCLAACIDYCGSGSFETYLIRRGIAVHHGQLPIKVRRAMTDVIRSGCIPITVATSTLTEGVNLPFDVILLPSIFRFQDRGEAGGGTELIPASEFRNLAGRAGRPGTDGEGMTLIALATEPAAKRGSKAHRQQRLQIQRNQSRFLELINKVVSDATVSGTDNSPLSQLLGAIFEAWFRVSNSFEESAFWSWLEHAGMESTDSGQTELNEAVDTLDAFLLSAVEEAEMLKNRELLDGELEDLAKRLWSRSYARFTSSPIISAERTLAIRASSVRRRLYPDSEERRRLYQLGLPPSRGKKFLKLATTLEDELKRASEYFSWNRADRIKYLTEIAVAMQNASEFRFDESNTLDWKDVLAWWTQAPGAPEPSAKELREWLSYSSRNFEYKLGTSIGAVIMSVWSRSNGGELAVPKLEEWKRSTGLPWAVYWLKDLLAWGTLDPIVSYLMADGRIKSRDEAEVASDQYLEWGDEHYAHENGDELYDPATIKAWVEESIPKPKGFAAEAQKIPSFEPVRDFSKTDQRIFEVYPLIQDDQINWCDAAGYCLAKSKKPDEWPADSLSKFDFWIDAGRQRIISRDVFSSIELDHESDFEDWRPL